MTSTPFSTSMPMPSPSSSTPVVVSGATVSDLLPETTSKSSIQPSSAAMLSISEEEMAKGTIALPAVNQTAPGSETGAMRPGKAGNSSESGSGDPKSSGAEKGVQQSQGASGNSPGPAGTRNGANAGNGGNSGSASGNSGSGNGGGGQGSEPTFTRITLPQNGTYGVVVVGSSMAEEFPETSRLWGGPARLFRISSRWFGQELDSAILASVKKRSIHCRERESHRSSLADLHRSTQ